MEIFTKWNKFTWLLIDYAISKEMDIPSRLKFKQPNYVRIAESYKYKFKKVTT